jgi:CTD small phosphatase-like protein 2
LEAYSEKYTIIFDLDETLVHCSFDLTKEGPRMTFGKGSSSAQAILYVRPHARELLKDLAEDFEVLVFTSSNKEYAREVVKRLDPKMQSISFLLHRDHCNIRNNT